MTTRLKPGNTGNRVRALHERLTSAGYAIDPAETETATFGPETRGALRSLQRALGLPETGELDDATLLAVEQREQLQQRLAAPTTEVVVAVVVEQTEAQTAPSPDAPAPQPPDTATPPLRPDQGPLPIEPLESPEKTLRREAVRGIALRLGLRSAAARSIADHLQDITAVRDDTLRALVKDAVIDEKAARSIGLLANLHQITGDNLAAAHALHEAELADLGGSRISRLRDLVKLPESAMASALADVDLPAGATPASMASDIRRRVARLYPTDALFQIVHDRRPSPSMSDIQDVEPVMRKVREGKLRFGAPLTTEPLGDAGERGRGAYEQLCSLARLHPGLGIGDILASNATAVKKHADIAERLNDLDTFRAANPEVELLSIDYSPSVEGAEDSADVAALRFDGLSQDAKRRVLADLRAWQRVHAITGDVDHAHALLEAGHHSATSIALLRRETFVNSGVLPAPIAQRVHQMAEDKALRAALALSGMIDIMRSGFLGVRVSNVPDSSLDYLRKFPSFSEMFGSQDYCNCAHCQSILSPAAYFVDLMFFVEKHVREPFFISAGKADSPLDLLNRRPDLWTLELSCENTNKEIPTLDVINEILAGFIRRTFLKGLSQDSDEAVYRALPRVATNEVRSFDEPFCRALEQCSLYLQHFGLTRGDLASALLPESDPRWAQAWLGITGDEPSDAGPISEANLIAAPHADLDTLERIYRGAATEQGRVKLEIDVRDLVAATGLDRKELGELIEKASFVNGGTQDLRFVPKRRSEDSIQNDIEVLVGADSAVLDRLHRFTRLRRKLGWTVIELDIALEAVGVARDGELRLSMNPTVAGLVQIDWLRKRLGISVEEACVLWNRRFTIRRTGPGGIPGPEISFVREDVHRLPGFLARRFMLTPQELDPKKLVRLVAQEDRETRRRIAAGLGLGEAEMAQLARGLQLLQKNAGGEDGFSATPAHLVLLYRATRLAALLRLSIPDYLLLMDMARGIENDDTYRFIRLHDWWRTSKLRLSDLVVILGYTDERLEAILGIVPVPTSGEAKVKGIVARLAEDLDAERPLEFAATIFAQIPGVTEQISREAVAHLRDYFVTGPTPPNGDAAGQTYRLGAKYYDSTDADKNIRSRLDSVAIGAHGVMLSLVAQDTGVSVAVSQQNGPDRKLTVAYDVPTKALTIDLGTNSQGAPATVVLELRSELNKASLPTITFNLTGDDKAGFTTTCERRSLPFTATVAATLAPYRLDAVLGTGLAAHLGTTPAMVQYLLGALGRKLVSSQNVGSFWSATRGALLEEIVRALLPLTTLLRHRVFGEVTTAAQVSPVVTSVLGDPRSGAAGVESDVFSAIDIGAVRRMGVLARLYDRVDDPAYTPAEKYAPLDDGWVSGAIDAIQKRRDTSDHLARLLRVDASLIASLWEAVDEGSRPLDTLDRLDRCAEIAKILGLNASALGSMASSAPDEIADGARALAEAFRIRHPDAEEHAKLVAPFDDRLRSRTRDGLCSFILAREDSTLGVLPGRPRWHTPADLYDWFLIDVMMEGCARTSKLVAATNSLQLYVQRCLLGLEQTEPSRTDIKQVVVELDKGDKDRKVAKEWEWRKNYRVWEANRKVFLWPENYLEPDIRDDKTPLFKELEQELLQREINEQTVLDAYTKYVTGFEEVGTLNVAGAYRTYGSNYATDAKLDTLHLFGVTQNEPRVHYYRSIDNIGSDGTRYGDWIKLGAQIPVTKVSPIVFLGNLYVFWLETRSRQRSSRIKNGESHFVGWRHTLKLKYIALQADGTWSAPQSVKFLSEKVNRRNEAPLEIFPLGDGVIDDNLGLSFTVNNELEEDKPGTLSLTGQAGIYPNNPPDDFSFATLKDGALWERPYLDSYGTSLGLDLPRVVFHSGQLKERYTAKIDLRARHSAFEKTFLDQLPANELPPVRFIAMDDQKIVHREQRTNRSVWYGLCAEHSLDEGGQSESICEVSLPLRARLELVNGTGRAGRAGWLLDGILMIEQGNRDLLYFGYDGYDESQSSVVWHVERLGLALNNGSLSNLLRGGVRGLLRNQADLNEDDFPLRSVTDAGESGDSYSHKPRHVNYSGDSSGDAYVSGLDFTGSLGTYFRELLFEIPFRVANHLHAQKRFSAARDWYHYIFDPTSPAEPGAADPQARVRGMWQYRHLRDQTPQKLRQALTDSRAIAKYKEDPFNPHAIARLRPVAYQKAIVMKYIQNLLDWGDSLFTEYTRESVNEAELLYMMAHEILGPRPRGVGDCGEATKLTYNDVAASAAAAEMFPEVEALFYRPDPSVRPRVGDRLRPAPLAIPREVLLSAMASMATEPSGELPSPPLPRFDAAFRAGTAGSAGGGMGTAAPGKVSPLAQDASSAGQVMLALLRQGTLRAGTGTNHTLSQPSRPQPVFCLPVNPDLRGYWDLVEDRLAKIRSCRDITGTKRELPLFAPEIDPRLLVRAKAAGLSLEDVRAALAGDLPPYRFAYLIEKAKQYAGMVQSFGSALLSAAERKDAEELSRLRMSHEHRMLTLTTEVRQKEISVAEESLASVQNQQAMAAFRKQHYEDLVNDGLSGKEELAEESKVAARDLIIIESGIMALAHLAYLMPQLGSLFALTFGGKQKGDALSSLAGMIRAGATIASTIADCASFQAGLDRRNQEWEFQRDLASKDLQQIENQLQIAKIRLDLAKRAADMHDTALQQANEVYEFFANKFTNLGLHSYLATTLQLLYRQAWNAAYSMAKLAEQAFRFERDDDDASFVTATYWQADRAGLLAGERLLLDLQAMERRFLETNYRTMEVDQSFSLAQLDPIQLLALRTTGKCTFTVGERFFDLFYPGQYRRRIKGVRLTIPCVTGPYINVAATLTLKSSWVRNKPKLDDDLAIRPPKRSVSIATSTAQADPGVFEFSFRDERYMPFEGCGAISEWELSLPQAFRAFDYQTINDVVLHISYSALYDGELREAVEDKTNGVARTLLSQLEGSELARVFSLRHEFSRELARLTHGTGSSVQLPLSRSHLPWFVNVALGDSEKPSVHETHVLVLVRGTPGKPAGSNPAGGGEPGSSMAHIEWGTKKLNLAPGSGILGIDPPTTAGILWSAQPTADWEWGPRALQIFPEGEFSLTEVFDIFLVVKYRVS